MDLYRNILKQSNVIFFVAKPADETIVDTNLYTMELLGMQDIIGSDFYSIFDDVSSVKTKVYLSSNCSDSINVNLLSSSDGIIPVSITLDKIDDYIVAFGLHDRRESANISEQLAHMNSNIIIKSNTSGLTDEKDKRVWQLNNIDSQTGLFNRTFFNRMFEKQMENALESNENLGIVLLDMDDFKLLNDKYGRMKGDSIISGLSQVILLYTRNTDYAIRYDDDCFLILLKNIKTNMLPVVIERIRENAQKELGITISAGCTIMTPDDARNGDELISAAYRALSKSKSEGKNKLTII